MLSLYGTYETKADDKGRVKLPSGLRKQLSPVMQEGFIIKRAVYTQSLELYPMCEWDELMKKINKLNRFKRKNTEFIRIFTAGVRLVEPDASGRILIPKDLKVFAGIQKELVLSATGSIIEIWDKEKYDRFMEDKVDDFPALSEEVMGGDDD